MNVPKEVTSLLLQVFIEFVLNQHKAIFFWSFLAEFSGILSPENSHC